MPRVNADELRQGIEQYESLQGEKDAITKQQSDIMAHLKGLGYETAAVRVVISERKKTKADVDNLNAMVDLYRDAIGGNASDEDED